MKKIIINKSETPFSTNPFLLESIGRKPLYDSFNLFINDLLLIKEKNLASDIQCYYEHINDLKKIEFDKNNNTSYLSIGNNFFYSDKNEIKIFFDITKKTSDHYFLILNNIQSKLFYKVEVVSSPKNPAYSGYNNNIFISKNSKESIEIYSKVINEKNNFLETNIVFFEYGIAQKKITNKFLNKEKDSFVDNIITKKINNEIFYLIFLKNCQYDYIVISDSSKIDFKIKKSVFSIMKEASTLKNEDLIKNYNEIDIFDIKKIESFENHLKDSIEIIKLTNDVQKINFHHLEDIIKESKKFIDKNKKDITVIPENISSDFELITSLFLKNSNLKFKIAKNFSYYILEEKLDNYNYDYSDINSTKIENIYNEIEKFSLEKNIQPKKTKKI